MEKLVRSIFCILCMVGFGSAKAQIAVSGIGGGTGDLPCWTESMNVTSQGGVLSVAMTGLCITYRDGTIATEQLQAGDVVYMMGVGTEFPSPNDLTDDANLSGALGSGPVEGSGAKSSVRFTIPIKGEKYAQVLIGFVVHKNGKDRTWLAPAKLVNGTPEGATVIQSHGGHQINAVVVEGGRVRLPTVDEKVAVCQATPAVDDGAVTNPSCTQKGGGGKVLPHPQRSRNVGGNPPPPPPPPSGKGNWQDPDATVQAPPKKL